MKHLFVLLLCFGCSDSQNTLVIAHQAGAGFWPANTSLAISEVLHRGTDGLHLDAVPLSDGWVIASSRSVSDSGCNGGGVFSSMSIEEVRQLRCQPSSEQNSPSLPPLVLSDLTDLLLTLPPTTVHLQLHLQGTELPQERVEQLLSQWHEPDLAAELSVWVSETEMISVINEWETEHGKLLSVAYFAENTPGLFESDNNALTEAQEAGADALVVAWPTTSRFVQRAQSSGIKVYIRDVGDTKEQVRVAKTGAFALVTALPGADLSGP